MKGRTSPGFALIEMLTVIAITGVILGLVGVIGVSLLRSERASHAEMAEEMTYLRLSRDFRRDVHLASDAEAIADNDAPGIRLAIPDGPSVEYRSLGRSVRRTATRDEPDGSTDETYDLGKGATPRFERDDRVVRLRFGTDSAARPEIIARLDRDRRFAAKGGEK